MTKIGRPHHPATRSVAFVAALIALVALAGCSTSENGAGTPAGSIGVSSPDFSSGAASAGASTSTGSAASSGSSGSPNAAALGAELEAVSLKPADLSSGYTLKLIDGGNQVTGQVTLDNCGYNFTSEAKRVARRQYGILDQSGQDAGISNELVAYDSAGSASLALSQWNQAASTCPKTPVHWAEPGLPDSTIVVTMNTLGNATLPVPTNVVTVESITAQGNTEYFVAAIQVHGQFLDAVYDNVATAPDSVEVNGVLQLAAATGARLARL